MRSYYTHSKDALTRRLAGKVNLEQVFLPGPSSWFENEAQRSLQYTGLDPQSSSMLKESAEQDLPKGLLVSSHTWDWQTVARDEGPGFWLRLSREEITEFDSEAGFLTRNPALQTTVYSDYDAFNFPGLVSETIGAVEAPFGITLPEYVTETVVSYGRSREQLAERFIVNLPDEQTVMRNGQMLDRRRFSYDDRGLLLHTETDVQSRYDGDFGSLESARVREATYSSATKYDGFGNVVQNSDGQGILETAEYDADGIFLIRRTVPKTNKDVNDLVWTSQYSQGRLASETDPRGLITKYSYDSLGRIESASSSIARQDFIYRDAFADGAQMVLSVTRRSRDQISAAPIQSLVITRADGQALATMEDARVEGKAVIRVTSMKAHDRQGRPVFSWTPFTLDEGAKDVAGWLASGQTALRTARTHGSSFQYDFLGRINVSKTPDGAIGKTLSLIHI